jgi:dihydrofolate reductase
MRKIFASAWVTLDGVFDAGTMDEWFSPYHSDARADWIREGILSCGAILVGRATYEMLAPYWSAMKNNEMGIADKLNQAPKFVVSRTLERATWNNSTILRENVVEAIRKLKDQPGADVLLVGSATLARSLMNDGLIDGYRLLVHPIVMGGGKKFFREGTGPARLTLVGAKSLDLGVTALDYRAANGGPC